MKKIYEQTNDLHVRNILFYGNAEDSKLYVDEALTKQATKAQAEDAFVKGQLLIKSTLGMFVPIYFGESGVGIIGDQEGEVTVTVFAVAVPEAE